MHKFFIDEKNMINEEKIIIHGPDKKHISDVLRLQPGEKILVSLDGFNYLSEIEKIDGKEVELKILEKKLGQSEPPINITLYQGLVKGNKLDFIIQKGTEIGIKEFVIVEMDRSVSRIKNQKWVKSRLDRYNKIAEEAAKQSKRDYIPKVSQIIYGRDMLREIEDKEHILIPYEEEKDNNIKTIIETIDLKASKDINIIIGPEGGISQNEINNIKEIGGKSLSLGPRILRTETAGLVASTILLYELGDLGSD